MSKNSAKVFEMLDVIVERIEEESVVQVITNNTTNYKLTGKLLMRKRKRLFCISCVVHWVDLILKDFEKNLEVTIATRGGLPRIFI